MNSVIPCSVGNVSLVPGIAFSTRKSNSSTRLSLPRSSVKQGSSTWRYRLPSFVASGVFSHNTRRCSFHKKSRTSISATETDVVVEEPGSTVTDEVSDGTPPDEVGTTEDSSSKTDANPASAKSRRSRPPRKSEMPPVKNEDLIPGATFTGKVKSIQPFGAFVDFGAFTDGLVHVSMLSDSFVKDVNSVVSLGQEVKVKLVEVNSETQRISLSMRENVAPSKQRKDTPTNTTNKPEPGKRSTPKPSQKRDAARKSTKFVKGQDLQGTVKNLTRSGAFISLPEGEEGFLPISEELDEIGSAMGTTSLEVGQEVDVRVLRTNRGQVTLTMKKEEDVIESDSLIGQGVTHTATNPFALAFRKNKDIAAFLDERDKSQNEVEEPETKSIPQEIEGAVEQGETVSDVSDVQVEPESAGKLTEDVPAAEKLAEDDVSESEKDVEASAQAGSSTAVVDDESNVSIPTSGIDVTTETETEVASESLANAAEKLAEDDVSESEKDVEASAQAVVDDESNVSIPTSGIDVTTETETEVASESLATAENLSNTNTVIDEAIQADDTESNVKDDSSVDIVNENIVESGVDLAEEEKESQSSNEKEEVAASASTVSDVSSAPVFQESSDGTEESDQIPSPESPATEVVENLIDEPKEDVQEQISATENGTVPENKDVDTVLIGQNGELSPEDSSNTDGTEEKDQVPSPESPVTEVVKASIDAEVEDKEVAIASEQSSTFSNSNGQDGTNASDQTSTKATISPALVKQLREETGAGMMDCKKALSETGGDIIKAQEYLRKKGLSSAEKKASRVTAEGRIGSYIHDSRIGILVEVNCETDFVSRGEIFKELVDDIAMQVAACPQVEYLVTEDVPEEIVNKEKEIEMQKDDLLSRPEQIRLKIVEGRIRKRLEELSLLEQPYIKNDKLVVKDWIKQTIATIGENIKVKRFVRFNLGEGLKKKSQDFAAEVAAQTAAKEAPTPAKEQPAAVEAKETEQKQSTVAVSAALVKQLREETGAGMMDCKKALAETGGDLEKAQEYLRKKGLSTADKKSSRLAAEGRISSYIHDSRIGVLVEVNCETDFVGRSEKFKELVDDLAMQIVACPQVQYVSIEDIPEEIVKKEKEIEMQREDLASKPENIREKIVEGRVTKRLGELALLEQPFIKDDSVLVKDLVKQSVASIGENIKVRRFVKFTLGESAENETKPEPEA
ncbi:polyprotein of EF-Ts, chloroplastic [Arachis stenosperma]|uniref:polyprotein of EF-Ts, chloroplastic n=1 Tax=Arachis stenosperma TaxID=217475 RepID=UPI0025ACAAC6|nr:polyprotein of EF-Ts, chloroplastic [Arachis stenosperma]